MRMILDFICGRIKFLFMMVVMLDISKLVQGDRIRLLGFGHSDATYRRRLLALGLTQGAELSIVRIAPLGCPVQVEVRGTHLALRKEEACHLVWEKI